MSRGEGEETLRLDGNSAAGLLLEIFRCEPSAARATCAGCGRTGPVGSLLAYALEMGAILRCPVCDTAILRVGAAGAARWIDVRGAVSIRFDVETEPGD